MIIRKKANIKKFNFLNIQINMTFLKIRFYKVLILILYFFIGFPILPNKGGVNFTQGRIPQNKFNQSKTIKGFQILYASTHWEKIKEEGIISNEEIIWEQIEESNYDNKLYYKNENPSEKKVLYKNKINSLNRSVIFNDSIIGPDISWLVPPGLKWNKRYKFDASVRGYSRRKSNESFWGFNGGDAVGQFYYQFINNKKMSGGINIGVRSVYSKEGGSDGTPFGEGLSAGFRIDRQLANTSGYAIGGEQLLHFDGLTDTGRDLYLTFTKGWWAYNNDGDFPLTIATAGIATGKMAEGTVKGLCSDLFGGSGTEIAHQRRLCWAPVFSIARVFNQKFSTIFEYNSYYFLLGTSLAPSKKIPIRGTFALILSDHIDNYKIDNFNEMTWVFRLSSSF